MLTITPRLASLAGLLATLASLALAASAPAHGGASRPAVPDAKRGTVVLRGCWMTVAYVPRPAEVLAKAFARPPFFGQTFYGPDPLLGIWALSCDRGRADRRRLGPVTLSLVGVPVELAVPGAPPLANFLAHALIRVDTSSRALASRLRRAGLPARRARMIYRHSPPGAVPFRAALAIPRGYGLAVSASAPDPTNPHDHLNRFSYQGRRGSPVHLALATADASDRFCFPASGGCSATVGAAVGSPLAGLLGGTSATARVGFDHARVGRLVLSTQLARGERR